MVDLVAELEDESRRRFVHWDGALWQRVVEGPARELAASLRAAGTSDGEAQRILEAYLRLACEGIGLGYLFPAEVGEGFFGAAFFRLIPSGLAAVEPARRAQALADCWNLGENLEHAPAWWRRIFVRLLGGGDSLGAIDALVERATREAFGTPAARLGARVRELWIDFGAEDRRFLPGSLHFVAPTVVCVHARSETERAGGPSSLGAWLVDPPLLLGPMGCSEDVASASDRLDLVEELAQRDPRAGDVLNAVANAWRACLTLETSQFLVALYPP